MQDFIDFYIKFRDLDFDIMFEAKDKEKSVLNAFKNLDNGSLFIKQDRLSILK